MTEGARRWDTDERRRGVADASASLPGIRQLAELAGTSGWVTEDAQAHLLPGMEKEIERVGLRLSSAVVDPDGALNLVLTRSQSTSQRELRQAVWSILGGSIELATYVHEGRQGEAATFEVVTGIPPDEGAFATHGHTIRIRVEPES